MSILGSKNYLIHAHFFDGGPDVRPSTYVGNFEELRRTIGTTWSQKPHRVATKANQVSVLQGCDDKVLATFTFVELTDQKIPDHF